LKNDAIDLATWGAADTCCSADYNRFRQEPGEIESEEITRQNRRYIFFHFQFSRREGRRAGHFGRNCSGFTRTSAAKVSGQE
jgi:hypothetical protein